jgi:excisionase family DNA binding protein
MQTEASLLTKQEVADRLKVSVRTVERMEAAGDLVAIRLGRSVRFRAEDVAALIGGAA